MSASSKASRRVRRAADAPPAGRKAGKDSRTASPVSSTGSPYLGKKRTFTIEKRLFAYTPLGYESFTAAARDGRVAASGSGTMHMRFAREQLVNQARQFERDNPIFGRMIDGASSYTVGSTGYGLQAKSGDKGWDRDAEGWWREYWASPDVGDRDSGAEIENLVCRELLTTGDVGVLLTKDDRIQVIESEQIKGPDLNTEGVDVDKETQRVKGYWVSPWSDTGAVEWQKAVRFTPKDFLYIGRRARPSARRAVPPCQRSFAMLHRINDVCDSEALAFQIQSRLAMIINKAGGPSVATKSSKLDPRKAADGGPDDRITEFPGGMLIWGYTGEEVKGVERSIPGANFPASITMFLRLLGLSLGLPIEMVLLDWTKSNYSQSRAVLEQAFSTFQMWQLLLERMFYRHVYPYAIDIGVRTGRIRAHKNQYKHEWIKPTFPWIDQLQEAEAKGKMMDRGLITHAQALKSLNKERDDYLEAREAELISAVEVSDRVFKKTGHRFPPEILCGLEHSVNAGKKPTAGDDERDADEDQDSRRERRERAAASAMYANRGPINLIVKLPRGPIKTTSRVLTRTAKGYIDTTLQEHEYGTDEEHRGTVTTVEEIPAGPVSEIRKARRGEVA